MIRLLTIFILLGGFSANAFIFNSGNGGTANNALHAENIDNATGANVDLQGGFRGDSVTVTTNVSPTGYPVPAVMTLSGSAIADGKYIWDGAYEWDGPGGNYILPQGTVLLLFHGAAHCGLDISIYALGTHDWDKVNYSTWTTAGGSITITVTVNNMVLPDGFHGSFIDDFGKLPPSINILTQNGDGSALSGVLHPNGDPSQIVLGDNTFLPIGLTTNLVAPNGVTYVFSNGILLTVTAAGSGGGGGGLTNANLVAYWSMDETSGTRYDGSPNHNDLVEAVGPVATTDGVTNSAALFGAGDANYPGNYLTLANPIVGMDLNADWTFNFWFNLGSDYGGFDGLVRLADSTGVNFFFLGNNNDNSLFMIVGDYSVNILPAGTATDLAGQWVQLNVSYVAGTGDLTISTNGVVFATGNNSHYFGLPLVDFEIGNQQEGAEAHAAIDEFYIWQTATP